MTKQHILGLDIGSETIKAVIAEPLPSGKIILHTGITHPSRGLRRGTVVDMEAAAQSVAGVLEKVRNISKLAHKNIYLRVGGSDVRVQTSRGVTAVSRANSEIHKDDVERVIEASRALNLPPNREILHAIVKEYIVDGVGDIQDPLGMVGTRLEVISLIVDAFQPSVRNLSKCVELAGGSWGGLIFGPLSSAQAVLTKSQKELGVVSIDIGYGTTGIAVYEESKLLHTKMFPIGAGHVTSDLAVALKVPVEVAETVKLSYGYALAKGISGRDTVDLSKIDRNVKGSPSRRFIAEVINSRMSEICELISGELVNIGKDRMLPAGVVVTGGGAKLPGIVDLIRDELKLATQIGLPSQLVFETNSQRVVEFLESPEHASVLGLVLWSGDLRGVGSSSTRSSVLRFLRSFSP